MNSRFLIAAAAMAFTCCSAPANPVAGADAGTPALDAPTMIGKMLRGGLDFEWLFEPLALSRIQPSPDQQAQAPAVIDLARAADARGLAERPDVAAALQGARTMILAAAMRRTLIDSVAPSDAEIAARLRSHPGRYDEYRLSHIFVRAGSLPDGSSRSDADALALANRLKARIDRGEAFETVAREASEDASTASEGGMLPAMRGPAMSDAFLPPVQALARFQTTQPVRGVEGYHLIRLEQRIPATPADSRYWVTEDLIGERLPGLISNAVAGAAR